MDGQPILQRDDTQKPSAKLGDGSPETITIVLLRLKAKRRLNDANTHLLRQLRALRQNLVLEIGRESEIRHPEKSISEVCSQGKSQATGQRRKTGGLKMQRPLGNFFPKGRGNDLKA